MIEAHPRETDFQDRSIAKLSKTKSRFVLLFFTINLLIATLNHGKNVTRFVFLLITFKFEFLTSIVHWRKQTTCHERA